VGPYSGDENNRRKTAIISLCEWRPAQHQGAFACAMPSSDSTNPNCPFPDTEAKSQCAHHSQPSPSKVVDLAKRANLGEKAREWSWRGNRCGGSEEEPGHWVVVVEKWCGNSAAALGR
jgi:hypothetical protein